MYNSAVIYCKVVLIPLLYDRDLVPDSPFIMLPNEATKGLLISKCPYEKSVWTKYQRKYFQDFCPGSLLLQGYYKTESIFLQTEHRLVSSIL